MIFVMPIDDNNNKTISYSIQLENHISRHKKLQFLEIKLFVDFFENEFRSTSSVSKKKTN